MQKPNDQEFAKMVYLKGIFMTTTIIIVTITICTGSTKVAYKKSIFGKSNTLKDKRLPQKVAIIPKGRDIVKTTPTLTTTTTSPTTSTIIASAMTTTIVEPTAAIVNNKTIAITTQLYSNNTIAPATTTTTATIPINVETPEEQEIEKVNNIKVEGASNERLHDKAHAGNAPPSSSSSEEEITAPELATLSEAEVPEVDVLIGATSQAVAVVQPAINASSTRIPGPNVLPESAKSAAALTPRSNTPVPCTCGVFLNSQFKRGSTEQPTGPAVIVNELDRNYACNAIGQKQCQTKCLEIMVQHLPNSANILCATLDRDCRKERAYLFIKNCRNKWINTNLAAGREYCCKNGQSYSCPLV